MGKPDTIIYSDAIFDGLLREFGASRDQFPTGRRVKKGSLSLSAFKEPVETGPLRRISDGGPAGSRQDTARKVRVGALADVAPMADAHGADMATYKAIIFDLDFELTEPVVHRIVELNIGVTGDAEHRVPVTWSTLAGKPHIILLILPRIRHLEREIAFNNLWLRLLGKDDISHKKITTNYQLVDGLPYKFSPFDFQPQAAGRVLAPNNYALEKSLTKKEIERLGYWIEPGTAFMHLDEVHPPAAIRQQPLCKVISGENRPIIAGSYRFEKSLVGFLPPTDLTPTKWIKAAVEISKLLDDTRRSPKKLAKMFDSDSLLRKMSLIFGEGEDGAVTVHLRIGLEEFKMTVPERTDRRESGFGIGHLEIAKLIQTGEIFSKSELAMALKWKNADARISSAFSDLRLGAEATLDREGYPGKAIADSMFPKRSVAITVPIVLQ